MLKPQNNRRRTVISLDGLWEYTREGGATPQNGFTPEGKIAVPASWNEQKNSLYHYKGRLYYQTVFAAPRRTAEERVMLRFAGLLFRGEFFLNGIRIGCDERGLLPVEFDITDNLRPSDNLLVVGIDGDIGENQAVGRGDFYEYGGLHRPVTLQILNARHIASLRASGDAQGRLRLTCRTTGGDRLKFKINGVEADWETPRESGEMTVPGVTPWSPEVPALYPLEVELYDGGELCDCYRLPVGFRTVEVSGRKILLNGKEIKLTGFGRHEDFPVLGKGMNHALNVRDFDLMKWCGANSFRTSHYPYSEEMMELADATGIMVIDELPFVAFDEKHFANAEIQAAAKRTVRELIERDFNHPAVISWSMGNECKTQAPESAAFFKPLFETAAAADPSRPLTYVAFTPPGDDHVYQFADIIGINRYYGWYDYPQWNFPARPGDLTKAIEVLNDCLDKFAALYEKPIILSEFGADCVAGLHSTFGLQFTEEFQAAFIYEYIRALRQRTDIAGMHVWNFADFSTDQEPLRVKGNLKGVFTRSRDPKAAAFILRQLWTGKHVGALSFLGEKEPGGPF